MEVTIERAMRTRNVKAGSTVESFAPMSEGEFRALSASEKIARKIAVATYTASRRAKLAKDSVALEEATIAASGPIVPHEGETIEKATLRVLSAPAYYQAKVTADSVQVIEGENELCQYNLWN